jgi:hypothetical protein
MIDNELHGYSHLIVGGGCDVCFDKIGKRLSTLPNTIVKEVGIIEADKYGDNIMEITSVQ